MKAMRLATVAAALLSLSALVNVDAFARDGGRTTVASSSTSTTEIRLRARLSGPVLNTLAPEGEAEFRQRSGRTTLKVEAEDVNAPAGTILTVTVGGTLLTQTITLNALLEGEIELRDAAVPAGIVAGTTVSVADQKTGTVIVSGVFK